MEGKNKKKGDRQIARQAYRPLAPGKRKQGRPEAIWLALPFSLTYSLSVFTPRRKDRKKAGESDYTWSGSGG